MIKVGTKNTPEVEGKDWIQKMQKHVDSSVFGQ